MANVARVRHFLQLINKMAICLTDEEIDEMSAILLKAIERMEYQIEKVTGIDPRD